MNFLMYLVLEHEVSKIYIKSSVFTHSHWHWARAHSALTLLQLQLCQPTVLMGLIIALWHVRKLISLGKTPFRLGKKNKTKQKNHKITTLTEAVTLNSDVYLSLINSECRVIFVTLGFFFFFFFYRSIYLFSRLGSSLTRDDVVGSAVY